MIGDNVTKPTENYEQLIQRFTKRTMQLNARQDELKGWYDEYIKNAVSYTHLRAHETRHDLV